MEVNINRNSSFELLRLIAQYIIVVYHILLFCFINNGASITPVVHKSICIPLHIGVILYVLISGYFGIRFALKSVFKIVANLLVYGLIFAIVAHFCFGDKFGLSKIFFISNSPFWFVNVYLMLYFLSPLLNKIKVGLTSTNRSILLVILIWISCYIGLLGFDKSFALGKNLINFILVYFIGDTISLNKDRINKIPLLYIVLLYLLVNLFSIVVYLIMPSSELAYSLVFNYNSPLLIINAICFFIPFMRIEFYCKSINYIATSCLAIYLIHSANLFMLHPIRFASAIIQSTTSNTMILMSIVFVLGFIIFLCAVFLDKILNPLWMLVSRFSNYVDTTQIGAIARNWSCQN